MMKMFTQFRAMSFLALCTLVATAAEPLRLHCAPLTLKGIPGEPLQLTLTAETAHAHPLRLQVPAISNLLLRTVERLPVKRNEAGRIVQTRTITWQGLEAGVCVMTNLTADVDGTQYCFPPVKITVTAVPAATPFLKPETP